MKKILIFGTFDIVHMGHIHMFKEAREYGDYLVVVIARDQNVEVIKGEQSFHNEEERREFLSYIKLIDEVRLGDLTDPYKVIVDVSPDIIALGYDQRVFVDDLEQALTKNNIPAQIVRLRPYDEQRYKSHLIKKYMKRIV